MSRVILNAMISPYPADKIGDSDQVWCCNAAFRHQPRVNRVYMFDELKYFPEGFADELNLLPEDVEVITTKNHAEVPRSKPYPIKEVIRHFHGLRYFTCTASYMLAQAIYEGFDEIVLSGMYYREDSYEYLGAKSCMDFWCGVAMGAGKKLVIGDNCALCKPFLWEPLYGYQTNQTREVIHHALATTYVFCSTFPMRVITHVDIDAPEEVAA